MSSLQQSFSSAITNRYIEIPKGRKVVIKIWRVPGKDSTGKSTKFITDLTKRPDWIYDEKIVGYLAEGFKLDLKSSYGQPFASAGNSILNTIIAGATNGKISLVNKYNQSFVYEKTEALSLDLELEFRTRYDAYHDVWRPINTLAMESLPVDKNGVLSSNYPNFFHFIEKITGSIQKLLKINNNTKTKIGSYIKTAEETVSHFISRLSSKLKNDKFTYIQVSIGDYFVLYPVLIENVSVSYSNELSVSRTELIAKLIELTATYTQKGQTGLGGLKVAEYLLNIGATPSLSDYSPSRRYPLNGKLSLNLKSMWGYTQEDAKRSMSIPSSEDKQKSFFNGESMADKMEKMLDKAILNAKGNPVLEKLVKETIGDLVPGGSI